MSKTTTARVIEELVDTINTPDSPVDDPADLRRCGLAVQEVKRAKAKLSEVVAAARANGRSWVFIGLTLGISKQVAQQRFGETTTSAPCEDESA